MTNELNALLPKLPELLKDQSKWESLLIDKYPPTIYRLSLKLSDDHTLILHKLFSDPNEPAYIHSHSWPFAIKIIEGCYEMGVGFSADRSITPPIIYKTMIKAGDTYEMTSSDVWHYTQPLTNQPSYSIMLVGKRWRERLAQNNSPLSDDQRKQVFDYFINKPNADIIYP
jgi:hypothetical protein